MTNNKKDFTALEINLINTLEKIYYLEVVPESDNLDDVIKAGHQFITKVRVIALEAFLKAKGDL